jgi:DNA-directed RNA polymerase subunit RPC12/RpoP
MSFKINIKTKGPSIKVDSWEIPLECPKCKTKLKVSLRQIEREETIQCNGCGTKIDLKDQNKSVLKGTENAQQALDDLERALRRIGT